MAAIAERPAENDAALGHRVDEPAASRPQRLRAEGVRIEATRAAVYDVLIDPSARSRWLGAPANVEGGSLGVHSPRVRIASGGAAMDGRGRLPISYVRFRVHRPDGAEVLMTFVLHALPWSTEVELHQQVVTPPNPRHRPGAGWRGAHWRRRILDALRREVEHRTPEGLRVPKHRSRRTPPTSHG